MKLRGRGRRTQDGPVHSTVRARGETNGRKREKQRKREEKVGGKVGRDGVNGGGGELEEWRL